MSRTNSGLNPRRWQKTADRDDLPCLFDASVDDSKRKGGRLASSGMDTRLTFREIDFVGYETGDPK
jgi:hypothetical protein